MADAVEPSNQEAEGAAYRWALRVSAVSLGTLAVVGTIVAGIAKGGPGAWGAIAGACLAALSGLVTQAAMVMGYRRAPHVFVSLVGGSWLAKMVVIVAGTLALGSLSGIDRGSFGIVVLVGIVTTLGIDLVAVRRAKIPYVASGPTSGDS